MEINVFEGVNKNELSMIEVAHAILEQRGDVMDFSDLVNQIQNYLETSDSEIRDSLAQFYTDLNIDGSFISLGDNRWGLRSWYAIDSIDEEVNHGIEDEDEDTPRRRKRKKVNAFINDDEEISAYNSDLQEIGADNSTDDEEELPDSIEEDLTIIDDDDEDDFADEEEEEE
ncbi:DNA-directed RNA polymerase subunit delta [Enterococcus casseliflavus]|nr:DNA-directed RNA polymerase subunit delta [Enterococcus casseliflavus]